MRPQKYYTYITFCSVTSRTVLLTCVADDVSPEPCDGTVTVEQLNNTLFRRLLKAEIERLTSGISAWNSPVARSRVLAGSRHCRSSPPLDRVRERREERLRESDARGRERCAGKRDRLGGVCKECEVRVKRGLKEHFERGTR